MLTEGFNRHPYRFPAFKGSREAQSCSTDQDERSTCQNRKFISKKRRKFPAELYHFHENTHGDKDDPHWLWYMLQKRKV